LLLNSKEKCGKLVQLFGRTSRFPTCKCNNMADARTCEVGAKHAKSRGCIWLISFIENQTHRQWVPGRGAGNPPSKGGVTKIFTLNRKDWLSVQSDWAWYERANLSSWQIWDYWERQKDMQHCQPSGPTKSPGPGNLYWFPPVSSAV
jgi:hypothetical protein